MALASPHCTICTGKGSFAEHEYVLPFGKSGYWRATGRDKKRLCCDGSGVSARAKAEMAASHA